MINIVLFSTTYRLYEVHEESKSSRLFASYVLDESESGRKWDYLSPVKGTLNGRCFYSKYYLYIKI